MNIVYRKAETSENDARGIAYVGAKSWYETYQGIMNGEYLNNRLINFEKSIGKTINFIKEHPNYFVCEVDNNIVGICNYGKSENEKYKDYGYLGAIYLLKDYQGLGIGKEMFKKAVEGLMNDGYNKMYLECAVGNDTINFYKKYGGQVTETILYRMKDFSIDADIVVFNDLNDTLDLLKGDEYHL